MPAYGIVLVLALAAKAAAAPASTAGLVTGTVRIQRLVPHLPPFKVAKDAHACGTEIADATYVVGPNRELANVVVEISGAPSPAITAASVTLDQVRCQFTPRVTAFPIGTTLVIKNSDATLHNTHTYVHADGQDGPTVFNLALPLKGMSVKKVIDQPGVLRYACDAGHAWMRAWSYVTRHPYVAVTDASGDFAIGNVPPGSFTLKVWHEAAGVQQQTVTIEDGKTTHLEVSF